MKKRVKKLISAFIPNGDFKEQIKLIYYSINKPKETSYNLVKEFQNKLVFRTNFKKISMITNEALYFVVPDFNYYQHFYKVKTNDIIVDAGANCGHLSILFSKLVGKEGRVYAFEPDRFNITRIRNNMQLNKSLHDNIIIEELLLWDENKLVDFCEAGTVGSSVFWISDVDKCVQKQAIRFDDWVFKNDIKKIDFIKMDIEGAEIEALKACLQTIKNLKPNFAIASYHVVNGQPTYIKVEEFFKKMDYSYKTIRFPKNEIITFAGASIKQ
jgi:FkbM family methyltransferase